MRRLEHPVHKLESADRMASVRSLDLMRVAYLVVEARLAAAVPSWLRRLLDLMRVVCLVVEALRAAAVPSWLPDSPIPPRFPNLQPLRRKRLQPALRSRSKSRSSLVPNTRTTREKCASKVKFLCE